MPKFKALINFHEAQKAKVLSGIKDGSINNIDKESGLYLYCPHCGIELWYIVYDGDNPC